MAAAQEKLGLEQVLGWLEGFASDLRKEVSADSFLIPSGFTCKLSNRLDGAL